MPHTTFHIVQPTGRSSLPQRHPRHTPSSASLGLASNHPERCPLLMGSTPFYPTHRPPAMARIGRFRHCRPRGSDVPALSFPYFHSAPSMFRASTPPPCTRCPQSLCRGSWPYNPSQRANLPCSQTHRRFSYEAGRQSLCPRSPCRGLNAVEFLLEAVLQARQGSSNPAWKQDMAYSTDSFPRRLDELVWFVPHTSATNGTCCRAFGGVDELPMMWTTAHDARPVACLPSQIAPRCSVERVRRMFLAIQGVGRSAP
ncbi:MAG: hypothetical protein KatS3mg132_471 [Limisphaera sp.]|nr:MAG: hypothetical protein KatS3mg132_471 [Limisphaera sp.]